MPKLATVPMGVEAILPEFLHRCKRVRSALMVGFDGDAALVALRDLRPGVWMSAAANGELPFEDSQFEVVLMDGACVNAQSVREALRVLRPAGRLMFVVNEKTGSQDGMTLPGVYKIVREGFNIVDVSRPPWWLFGLRGRTIAICAQKKNWRNHTNTYRPYI